jgi:hypothetical protein
MSGEMSGERSDAVEPSPHPSEDRPLDPGSVERPSPELPASDADVLTTAARLLVGSASLGLEAVKARLQSLAAEESRARAGEEDGDHPAGSATDTMIGAATKGARTVGSVASIGAGFARRGLKIAGGVTETVGRMVPGFLSEPAAQVRRRARERMGEVRSAGRDELARARNMARSLVDETLDSLIERLAEDPAVREAIRTQSTSAVEDAVDDVRNRAAVMDDRIETLARRLLRRRPRDPAPPSP